jgi:hypothetical protein
MRNPHLFHSRRGEARAYHAAQIAARQRRGLAAISQSQSAHQRRATEVLSEFDNEKDKAKGSNLATFLLLYTCCASLGCLLQASVEGIPPNQVFKNDGIKIDLRKLRPAIHRFQIPVSDQIIDEIFGSSRVTPGQRSCRVLRNGVVHGLQKEHVAEVNDRHAHLRTFMTDFIDAVRSKAQRGSIF